jgi:hypothetical protein
LTPEVFERTARDSGRRLGANPLNLAHLVWLAIASARHTARNFADVLGLTLKLLWDAGAWPVTAVPPVPRPARRSQHDPRGADPTQVTEEAVPTLRRLVGSTRGGREHSGSGRVSGVCLQTQGATVGGHDPGVGLPTPATPGHRLQTAQPQEPIGPVTAAGALEIRSYSTDHQWGGGTGFGGFGGGSMRWDDRVYGEVSVDDPKVLALIACPTFQRLKGIRQAGPSAFAFPFKTVTRYEHSLGVYVLLRRLGAGPREQVAGLLHDISHTAFSHAVDFVFSSEEQDHHEELKPLFLERPDIADALADLGYAPREFFDDSVYPLLERPLPCLCADRLDYFLRDGLACSVISRAAAGRVLAHVEAADRTLVFTDAAVAREAAELFAVMNRDWWASETEAYIYNEFADALREGFRRGALSRADLFEDDAHVLARLRAAGSPLIDEKLEHVAEFRPNRMSGFVPRVLPKTRWLDPPVKVGTGFQRLSEVG